MNIVNITEVLNLIKQLTDVRSTTVSPVSYPLQKPKFSNTEDVHALECATPESQGLASELILDYLKELRADKTIEIQNIMIVKNSKKIFEISFDDHNIKLWKQTFSACKSLVSIAVGFAVSEGLLSLETPITEIFSEEATSLTKRTMKDITVEDLLTMRSAVSFSEIESIVSTSWKRDYLSSALKGAPGKTFHYNSLNTYMLAAAVIKKSGIGLTEYLRERLFDPLGIGDVFWEKSPEGIEKGGWGLYIRPEDMAKIGICMLNGGIYNDIQVMPPEWIRAATYPKAETPKDAGRFDYGYQIWCGRDSDTFLFNGMFGQNMMAFRNHNMIIISNCANSEIFQSSNFYSTTLRYFSDVSDKRISHEAFEENIKALSELEEYKKTQRIGYGKEGGKLPDECKMLDNTEVVPTSTIASSVGIMPLSLQLVTGNYSKGTESVKFMISNEKFYIEYRENDAVHRFPVGFARPLHVNMKFGKDFYRVAVSGSFSKNEDDISVLKLRLCFAETPFVRTIKIFFDDKDFTFVYDETPIRGFALDNIIGIKDSLEDNALLRGAVGKIDDDYIEYKINRTFHPELQMIKYN